MRRRVSIIFEDHADAVRANEALIGSPQIQTPLQQTIVRPPVGRTRASWQDGRAIMGITSIGAAAGLLIAVVALSIATATGMAASTLVTILAGLIAGAICGILLGVLTSSIEPSIRRLDQRLRPGQAVLSAAFMDSATARQAKDLLLHCPGAIAAI